ncbi:SOCS box domain-containing protein [Caerostris darwini]|uniref:SOCS box domain-containing protein n=1 Tax=Caerostris darwini TaxID=1538125 RepID=A0AAV4PFI9_9ARAC|nr:SOCS box domain-containing protein [Caerostris darwini]
MSSKRAIINYYACPVTYAVIAGDIYGLECLLRYGFEVNEYQMEKFNAESLSPLRKRCTIGHRNTSRVGRRTRAVTYRPAEKFELSDCLSPLVAIKNKTVVRNNKFPEDDCTMNQTSRRIIVYEVFIFMLRLSVIRSQPIRARIIQCFRYVWRSRSTPYVKAFELLQLLEEEWFNKHCPYLCWNDLKSVSKNYLTEFGEIAEGPVQPRSLKQLCRCAVRRAIMKSFSWDSGIEGLRLPKKIISYLHLEV